jgi:hypothetical protein
MENITPPGTPAKHTLAVLDNSLPAPPGVEVAPSGRISGKVKAAIDAMVNGDCKNITAAAEKVGMARESLSRALNKPHIAEFMRQKVIRSLAMASARAGAVKQELLDSDNAMVRDRASSFVLGLAGIQPVNSPSINVNLEIRAGYVIDISPGPREVVDPSDRPMRVISPAE